MSARNGVSSFTFNYISSIIFVLSIKKTSLEHHKVSYQTFFFFLKTPLRILGHSLDSMNSIFLEMISILHEMIHFSLNTFNF